MSSSSPRVIVIGAGSTGAALAHDLAQRGVRVEVVERSGVASGTTGHNQGQLHSGARYAVLDPKAARECMDENRILRRILPRALEWNGGLFVGWADEHIAYLQTFLEACAECGIPAREICGREALVLEPGLTPRTLVAVEVPDAVFDPYRFCLSFLATAQHNGARVRTFTDVVELEPRRGRVTVVDCRTGKREIVDGDLIVNAAGPWAGRVAAMAGAGLEVEPSAGVCVVVDTRVCHRVLNVLAPPADSDIIVPLRGSSVLGTTSWTVTDPDEIPVPAEHIEAILRMSDELVPGVSSMALRGAMAAARPLAAVPGSSGRAASRGFRIVDHAPEGADGLISVVGGKTTTARAMAERTADLVCARLGLLAPCRSMEIPLLPARLGVMA